MTDAPKRIQVRWTKSGTGHVATPASAGLVANCAAQYLSTEALASSPEVAKLVAEAEARGMERAARIAWESEDVYGARNMHDMAKCARNIAAAIRSEATK